MGLILQKYIPDVARLSQDNWEGTFVERYLLTGAVVSELSVHDLHIGVVANETDLVTYFDNYIMHPVLSKAMPGSSDQHDTGSTSRCVHNHGGDALHKTLNVVLLYTRW